MNDNNQQKPQNDDNRNRAIPMGVGVALGVALGAALHNIGLGLGIGVLIGGLGSIIRQRTQR